MYLNNNSYDSSTRFCSTCKYPSSGWSNSTIQIPNFGRFPAEDSHRRVSFFCSDGSRWVRGVSIRLRVFWGVDSSFWLLFLILAAKRAIVHVKPKKEQSNSNFWVFENFLCEACHYTTPRVCFLSSSTREYWGGIQHRLSLLRVASSTQDLGDHAEQRQVGATSGIGRCETSWGDIEADGIIHCAYLLIESKRHTRNSFFLLKFEFQNGRNGEQFLRKMASKFANTV